MGIETTTGVVRVVKQGRYIAIPEDQLHSIGLGGHETKGDDVSIWDMSSGSAKCEEKGRREGRFKQWRRRRYPLTS